jgi:predicted DNA-binding transcriptional regulator AlpA
LGLITLKEVQKLTGFSPESLRTRRCRGKLPFPLYKAEDDHWRADEAEVRAWIEKTKREGKA